MSNYQTFRHYRISQDAKGAAVELWRSDADIVCLAVDMLRQVFVELHVAIIDPAQSVDLRTFTALCTALGQVRNQHVLEVVDWGEDEEAKYAVTEFIDGERLDTWLARCNPLPPWLALQIMLQVADGLEALSQQPRLLCNLEIFNSALQLLGDSPAELCVKLGDFRLALVPPKAQQNAAVAEDRLVQDSGRLLAYMLTGSAPQDSEQVHQLKGLTGELLEVVTIFMDASHPQHPRSFTDMSLLLETLVASLPAETTAVPRRLAASLRPRLPLQSHMTAPETAAESMVGTYQLSSHSYDAVQPYRLAATTKETRQSVNVHLLPPERLMPRDFTRAIRSTLQRVNSLDHPHLLCVKHLQEEEEGKDWLVEESGGNFTLADLLELKGPLSPGEAVILLEHLQEASKEAEACGLTPVVRSLQQVYLQFRPATGQSVPGEKELQALPLDQWPPFYLRVRTYPTTVNLTQPGRYVLERQVGNLPNGSDPGNTGKLSSLLTAPTGREFALITHWLTMGHPSCGEKMRHLLLDYLAPKRGRTAPAASREFLDRLSIQVGRSATRKAAEPARVSRKSRTAVEEASNAAAIVAPEAPPVAKESAKAPLKAETKSSAVAQGAGAAEERDRRQEQSRREPARAFGAGPALPAVTLPEDPTEDDLPVGFAEALFQKKPLTDNGDGEEENEPTPAQTPFFGQTALSDEGNEPGTRLFGGQFPMPQDDQRNALDSAEEGLRGGAIDPELLVDEPEEKMSLRMILLWALFMIMLAALVAAAAAHFLKTARWVTTENGG